MDIEDNKFDKSIRAIMKLLDEVRELIKAKNRINGENILDNQDLCMMFNLTPRTLQRYRSEEQLPFIRIAGKSFYYESEVRKFMESKRQNKPPQKEE